MIKISFDVAIDLETGDLTWNSIRDLSGVEAENLIQQRIHNRLLIERGSFIYDRSGTLGSRITILSSLGIPQTKESLEMLIREALEPMDDINILTVDVYTFNDGTGVVTDPRRVQAKITFQLSYAGSGSDLSPSTAQSSTVVTIPAV